MGNCLSINDSLPHDPTLPTRPRTNQKATENTTSPSQHDILNQYSKAGHAIQAARQTEAELFKVTDICSDLSAQKNRYVIDIAASELQYEITLKRYRTAAGPTERVQLLIVLSELDEYLRRVRRGLKAVDEYLAAREERVLDLKRRLEDEQAEVKKACAGLGQIERALSPQIGRF